MLRHRGPSGLTQWRWEEQRIVSFLLYLLKGSEKSPQEAKHLGGLLLASREGVEAGLPWRMRLFRVQNHVCSSADVCVKRYQLVVNRRDWKLLLTDEARTEDHFLCGSGKTTVRGGSLFLPYGS